MSEYNKAIRRSVENIWRGLQHAAIRESLDPVKIKKDGRTTVVFWKDGSATAVKCSLDDEYDSYMAFCAALGKKVFGSTNGVKRVLKETPIAVIDPVLLNEDGTPASKQIADKVLEQPRVYSSSTFTVHESDIAYPDVP